MTDFAREGDGRRGEAAPEVVVVMVTFRSRRHIRDSLEALRAALEGMSARVVIVDNASDDDSADLAQSLSPDAVIVRRIVNDGFAAGCRVGADAVMGRRLLFINPDVVVGRTAIRQLTATADRFPDAGIVGGRAVMADGTTTDPRSWWGRPTFWSTLCFATGLSSVFPGSALFDPESADGWDGRDRRVDVVSGGLMLVERAAWDLLGGFDETFRLYGEDTDLCLRARRIGLRPRVAGDATFRHEVGGSSGSIASPERLVLMFRGKATVLRRHLPAGVRRLSTWLLVLGCGLRAFARRVRPGHRPSVDQRTWRAAWARRAEWRHGWSAGDVLEAPQGENVSRPV